MEIKTTKDVKLVRIISISDINHLRASPQHMGHTFYIWSLSPNALPHPLPPFELSWSLSNVHPLLVGAFIDPLPLPGRLFIMVVWPLVPFSCLIFIYIKLLICVHSTSLLHCPSLTTFPPSACLSAAYSRRFIQISKLLSIISDKLSNK